MAPVRTNDKEPQEGSSADGGGEPKQRRKPGRVPVSCAECRRLKLRCDRQVPCESCKKRGCAALCPDGSLPTTKGPKLKAAAEVEELKEKIASLEAVLRELSQGRHPLLPEQNFGPNAPIMEPSSSSSGTSQAGSSSSSSGAVPSPAEESPVEEGEEEILDAFGTLTVGTRGEARFFGQTSRTEYLIHAPERLGPSATSLKLPRLTQVTVDEASKELDAYCTSDQAGEELLMCMPTMEEALRLCDIFFDMSKFLWYPLPRDYVYTEIVLFIYKPPSGDYCHVTKKHALSLLFMIFALATLFDLNMPPYSAEAMEYFLLARIAMRWAPPTYDTTLAALQSMLYMAQYLEMSDCEPAHTGSHKAWVQTRHICTLGYSIGLHVSGCKWQLDPVAINKRSRVFWQMFAQDTWLSFGFGRPPSINLAFVDCEIPQPEEIFSQNGTQWSTEFHVWCWQFSKVLHNIMTTAFCAKSPTYSKIIELDKRIRDFPDPPCIAPPTGSSSQNATDSTTRTMQSLLVTLSKDTTHLNLHRSYLSQALKDSPEDPLRHKYGASVMIIYRSAWRILNALQSAYRTAPGITARISFPWSHSLACAILLCLMITRAPTSALANPALAELDKVCDLFEEAANSSQIATNNIHVLRKLRKQAHAAVTKAMAEDAALVNEELDRLGGRTQLIRTVGERRLAYCSNLRFAHPAWRGKEMSVFETQPNPNGYVQGFVSHDHDQRMEDPISNPPPCDNNDIFSDFLSFLSQPPPVPVPPPPPLTDIHIGDIANAQNTTAEWIQSFLESNGGPPQTQAQVQAGMEPVPPSEEMDATWQALVSQLGITFT